MAERAEAVAQRLCPLVAIGLRLLRPPEQKGHRLGLINHRNSFLSSGGWKSKMIDSVSDEDPASWVTGGRLLTVTSPSARGEGTNRVH